MRHTTRLALLGLVSLFSATSLAQQMVYVSDSAGDDAWDGLCEEWDGATCGPKATIQAGINAATDGDTVLVADGTYTGTGNKNLDFGGKDITVRSASGDPAACVIDCQTDGRAFHLHSGESRAATIDAFTITNGRLSEGDGGGVCCVGSSPTISNCVFLDMYVEDGLGAGIYSSGGAPLIVGCRFDGCQISSVSGYGFAGAGIYCSGGAPEIIDNFFVRCTFNVFCTYGGGAIGCENTDILIRGNEITACGGHGAGGGIWGRDSQINISHNRIYRCAAYHYGGAMAMWNCAGKLTNNEIVLNRVTDMYGGGIRINGDDIEIAFSTIAYNRVGYGSGGGVYVGSSSTALIHHSILWGNHAGNAGDQLYAATPDDVTVRYCDVQDGWAGVGNLDADPSFVVAPNPGPDGEWGTVDDDPGDVHLRATSPCVDAGDPDYCAAGQYDIDGEPRLMTVVATRVDIGADELTGVPYIILGDLNCDCAVNVFDIDPFVLALVDPAGYAAAFPDCDRMLADVNCDGYVNAFDIDPFVQCLTAGDCPPCP
jgi:hypothetical protein